VTDPTRLDNFIGCLIGGAVGDALGAAVEFDSWPQIQAEYGLGGITRYQRAYGRYGAITDDTQMTLFTAEGLIRSSNRMIDRGVTDVEAVIHRAYERWLLTQVDDPSDVPWDPEFPAGESGWLITHGFLHHRRAPGDTCLSALMRPHTVATADIPLNDSKGCGGVMRVAPVGLVADDPFAVGCRAAALTHGHPTGWIAAGVFAEVVAHLAAGGGITEAVEVGLARSAHHPQAAETATAVEVGLARSAHHPQAAETATAVGRAVDLATSAPEATVESVETLGEGWVAEEALAIAVYCALTAKDFPSGLIAAVNHSGDSDSTGALTGNLLGALFGANAIDGDLTDDLEGAEVIDQIARDLHAVAEGRVMDPRRYPPW
jgi:ADP-ribosylglycohydrolase